MGIVTIEKPLREKLGDAGSDALVHLINQSQDDQKKDVLEYVEEKFERRLTEEIGQARIDLGREIGKVRVDLGHEIGKVRVELVQEIGKMREEFVQEFSAVRAEFGRGIGAARVESSHEFGSLRSDMYKFKSDLTRWMFIFWIGQVGVILGALFVFLK